jgi:hypothetical protein
MTETKRRGRPTPAKAETKRRGRPAPAKAETIRRGRPKAPEIYVEKHLVETVWEKLPNGVGSRLAVNAEANPLGRHQKALIEIVKAGRKRLTARRAIERLSTAQEINSNYANRVVATAVNTGVVTVA